MSSIDFILNVAALLLWFNWRSIRFDPLAAVTLVTLAGTLKRTENKRLKGWQFLAAVLCILLLRGLLYWQVGSAAGWTPRINLFLVILAFRIDLPAVVLLFSMVSFIELLIIA